MNDGNDRGIDSSKVYEELSIQSAMQKQVLSASNKTACLPVAFAASSNVIVPAKELQTSPSVGIKSFVADVNSQMLSINCWRRFLQLLLVSFIHGRI